MKGALEPGARIPPGAGGPLVGAPACAIERGFSELPKPWYFCRPVLVAVRVGNVSRARVSVGAAFLGLAGFFDCLAFGCGVVSSGADSYFWLMSYLRRARCGHQPGSDVGGSLCSPNSA